MSDGYISKAQATTKFTTIHNELIHDNELSFSARFLLIYMLSLPADWKIRRSHLSTIYEGDKRGHGTKAINSMFDELIENEYVVYERTKDEKGYWVHNYYVYPVRLPIFKKMFPEPFERVMADGLPVEGTSNTKERANKRKRVEKKEEPPGGGVPGGGEIFRLGEEGNCLLTADDKEKLLKKMKPEDLEYWIEEVNISVGKCGGHKGFRAQYNIKSDTYYFVIRSWKRKREADGKSAVPASKAHPKEATQEYLKKWVPSPGLECHYHASAIQFKKDHHAWELAYEEKGYWNQLEKLLFQLNCTKKPKGATA